MGKTRRIRTILYGDQKLDATEIDLLHTPALQRLYDLHQLGLADRVFIDASHSRLHHVVGVLQQVENLIAAIIENLEAHPDRVFAYYNVGGNITRTAGELAEYVRRRRSAVRLMGFLHDLTHSPFGHTLEDEIQLLKTKHDEPERQARAFYRLLCQYISWLTRDSGREDSVQGTWGSTSRSAKPEDEPKTLLARYLDAPDLLPPPEDDGCIALLASLAAKQLTNDTPTRHMSREPRATELCQFLHDLFFALRGLLYLDCIHKDNAPVEELPKPPGHYTFEKLITKILEAAGSPVTEQDAFHPQRDAFLLDVIGNTICADLLDYAKRDSHFAGLRLDYDTHRIVENFTLVSHNESPGPSLPAPLIRTAISIFSHKLRLDVPGELLNLLQVRFYLSQRVLFHPTKCVAGAMLGTALQLIRWKGLPDHLEYVGDSVFLHQVSEATRIVRDLLKKHAGANTILTEEFIVALIVCLDAIPSTGITLAARKILEDRKGHSVESIQFDLRAAIRLLDRLSARRYHRPIFRVLPGVNAGGTSIDASDIAGLFRHPTTRFRMEREIEKACELPPGTVVIHCPNSEGPRKIAAMLIAMEHGARAHKLRDIAKLHDVFSKHQKAIRALEDMYASMWRLVVAVAPPFRTDHERINKAIARVLYEEITEKVLNSRQDGELPNDPLMCRELDAATANRKSTRSSDVVRIKDNRGSEKTMSAKEFEVSQLALKMLKSNPVVQEFLREQPAGSGDRHVGNSSLSIESLETTIAEQFGNKLAVDEPKPVIIEASPPEPVKILEFSKWFNSVDEQLPDSKTRRQFRKAKPRLKDLCQPLPPELRTRFFSEFGEQLISQSIRTVSNYVNADQLISDANDRVSELLCENEKCNEPRFEAKPLWDSKDESK